MKRLLSLILVAVMLLSLLPAYAAPAEGEVADYGVKILYTPVSDAIANESSGFLSVLDEKYTNGFYRFHGLSASTATSSKAPGGHLLIRNDGLRLHNVAAVGFDVYIPAAGTYTMEMNNWHAANGRGVAVWLGEVDKVKFKYKDNDLGKQVGSYSSYGPGENKTSYIPGIVIDEAGWYTISFIGDTATAPEGVTWGNYCYIGDFSLTSGTGEAVPMLLTSELDKTAVTPNDGTAKMTVTAFMSDGTEEDYTDKVSYSVTGNATVAPDGTVTGGDEGVATVTATLELSGREALTTSQTIKVASYGVKILYTAASDAIANKDSGFLSVLDEKYTNGFYRFRGLSGESGTSSSAPGGQLEIKDNGLSLHKSAAIGFDVYIPVAGTYTMKMTHNLSADGTSAAVWFGETDKVKLMYGGNELGTQVGSYLCYPSGDNKNLTSVTTDVPGITVTEPGWYTLSFTGDTVASAPSGETWGDYIYVGDFWLTSGTEETVPMKKSITVDDDDKASASILLSNKEYVDLSGATIKWKSSNPGVVDIGEVDAWIDIYAVGKTELSAEIYFDGILYDTVTDTYEVTELPPQAPCANAVYSYDFLKVSPDWKPFTNMGTDKQQTSNTNVKNDDYVLDITYDYTDGNWEWFGVGPKEKIKIGKTARLYSTHLRLYPGSGRWYGLAIKVPTAGKYGVNLEYLTTTASAGDANIYIIPRTKTQQEMDPLVNRRNYVGYVNFLSPSKSSTKSEIIGTVDIKEPGEYVIVFEQGSIYSYFYLKSLKLDGINNMKYVDFEAENNEVTYGKTVETSITAKLLDGTVLEKDAYSVLYESSDPDIASVDENGVITGRGHGEVTITATVQTADSRISESIVINAIDDTEIVDKKIQLDDSLYVGEKAQISFVLSMKSGNEIKFPREEVTFASDNGDAIRFEEAGYIFAAKEAKSVTVSASASFRGEEVSADKEISVILDEGKTESTYYTTEKREIARKNAEIYDWAKSMKKSAVETADGHIENFDILYDMIIGEGLPRSTQRGAPSAPNYNICRYCDGGIDNKGGDFITNVISRPWQTQCPECKRLFPSNDFGSFLQLGLDREKRFSRIRALEAHRAMLIEMGKSLPDAGITDERKAEIEAGDLITAAERAHYGFGVEGGYLVNKLYPELSNPAKIPATLNNSQGLRPGEDWRTWGVDDGWGYIPLREDGVTPYQYELPSATGVTYALERHVYIAVINDVMMKKAMSATRDLADAYLYTDDIKYGRAGAILLDRIADVYHTYDLFTHNDIDYDKNNKPDRVWYNTDGGGTGIGILAGKINENVLAQMLALSADALYPALTDTQVIDYLSEKAEFFGYDKLPDDDKYDYHMNYTNTGYSATCEGNCREYEHEMRRNAKTSSHDIWKNWENGIIRKIYWGVKFGRIVGNFGQRQATTAIAAVVQDRYPETSEMLEWIYQPANPDGTYNKGGGGVTNQLIGTIDRDGMGDESSVNYNRTQIEGLGQMADYLADYKDADKYNLYENPKFHEMFMAFVRPVVPEGHPKLADVSSALSHGYFAGDIEIWKNGFKNLRDTDIADELAQYIWMRNGKTAEGLHYDIFTENPESFEAEVEALVDVNVKLKSELMAGWGFAVLQDGGIYTSASASTETNNQRAFWITAGDTAGHGHQDALHLNVDAFGLDLGADLGYPEDTLYHPNRIQWSSQTISHNTVMVNKKDSKASTQRGFPLHFNDSGMVKLMDIDASGKYDETENYRRSLVMVKIDDDTSYGVDFFRVTGGNHHMYIYHSASSKVNEVSGLKMATEPELIQVDKNGTMDWATFAGKDAAYVKNQDGSVRRALPGEEVDFETVFPVTYGQDPWTDRTIGTYERMFPNGYTWLRNIRRAAEPQSNFTVDFEITDYKKVLSNPKGIHLRMTQVNDFTPSGVAFAGGHIPQRSSAMSIGYKDKFNPERTTMLEYVYVEREAPEGQELDSLFTTVYEPYRNTSNIEKIEAVNVTKVSGDEQTGDMARAVKVTHVGGERIDYVVYATNNSVKYNVGGVFDFQGFVGVYSTNSEGAPTYRYVHDGNIIGDEVESEGTLTGKVEGFERNLAFKNYIDVSAEIEDASALAGEYIFIANDGTQNAVYKIEGASVLEEHSYGEGKNIIRLDIGRTTLIRGHQNASNPELGYLYNIAPGQTFRIPLSYNEDFAPEFESVNDSITTSAGSTISVPLSAQSPIEENAPKITYIGTTLPRGASIDAKTGVFTWKPDSSQIGENHVAITARDADGRETTIHFNVTVYGSTTGGSSSNNNTETPSENTGTSGDTSTPAGGGGGGGGGGAAPTDKPDDTANTDENDASDENGEGETSTQPDAGNSGELKFTDLDSHSWAEDAINTLAADGIIKGTSASTYSPANNITRADFAILLVRAFDLSSDNAENFADVSANDYFASELAIARNNGIVSGIGDNKFAPRNTITRQDMMVIVYRALEKLGVKLESADVGYEDFADVADYAQDAVKALITSALVNGKSERIAPTDYTTRAEVAVLIKRMLDYIK